MCFDIYYLKNYFKKSKFNIKFFKKINDVNCYANYNVKI